MILNHVLYSEVNILSASAYCCLIANIQNYTDDMFRFVHISRLQLWPKRRHAQPPYSERETPLSHSKQLASCSSPEPDESNAHRYTLIHNYVPNQLVISFGVPLFSVLNVQPKFENV